MKKQITIILTLCAAAIIGWPASSSAQNSTNAPATAPAKKRNITYFKGDVKSVDANASTITVSNLTLQVTARTKMVKDGQSVTLSDIKEGDVVHGIYRKTDDGKLIVTSLRDGKYVRKKKPAAQ